LNNPIEEKHAMIRHRFLPSLLILGLCSTIGRGVDGVPKIADDDFDRLLAAVKPQKGESPWRDIPWLTNVTEARRRAVAEDKPLVIFTAADGSPLSRT
jgi:hypothetical protein